MLSKKITIEQRHRALEQVVRERGYMVICEENPAGLPIGEVMNQTNNGEYQLPQPFLIAAETDFADWMEQGKRFQEMGIDARKYGDHSGKRYYRAVTD